MCLCCVSLIFACISNVLFSTFFFLKKIKPHCFSISKAVVSMCAFLFSRDESQKISLLLMREEVQIREEREVLGRVKDAGLQCGAHL